MPEGYHLAIDWRAESGFGLTSDAEHGYGEPADEHYSEFGPALMRSVKLIKTAAEDGAARHGSNQGTAPETQAVPFNNRPYGVPLGRGSKEPLGQG